MERMNVEILYPSAYALANVTLGPSETIRAEAGAMVMMDADVQIKTEARGGLLKSFSRAVLGQESFFVNTFVAGPNGSSLALAPSLPGDVIVMQLDRQELIVQSGSYLAGAATIEVETKWGGARSFFGGEGLFMLRCSGSGPLVVSSYGAIHRMTLAAGQRLVVDTGHIVAFDGTMSFQVQKAGSWKSTIFGGEGFVCAFTGPGELYAQTRSPEAFLGWLIPRLPRDNSN
jgi:uncharacterized protein (TIGR00266 family)